MALLIRFSLPIASIDIDFKLNIVEIYIVVVGANKTTLQKRQFVKENPKVNIYGTLPYL